MTDEPQRPRFTFGHFVEPQFAEAKRERLGDMYTDEEIASTAWVLSIMATTLVQLMYPGLPLSPNPHDWTHRLTNELMESSWLTAMVKNGSMAPDRFYEYAIETYPHFRPEGYSVEDQKLLGDGIKPMDKDTFTRLWGTQA